jgi:hypothetical protein
MDEKRKEERKKLMAFTPVYLRSPRALLGYLGDLTVRGAMIIGQHPAEVDRQVMLVIEFPAGLPETAPTPFVIPARVARCQQDESPRFYNIGVEFTQIEAEQVRIIEAILKRYQFQRDLPA